MSNIMKSTLFNSSALTPIRRPVRHMASVVILASAIILFPIVSKANPKGGVVVDGTATIATPTANLTTITQTTDKAAINWQSFNIGAGQHTQFIQPSASSITLNRVVGGNPSEILGRLSANGTIMLVNPDGILFGRNSRVDVAGLVASTHDIRTDDFMAGKFNFNIPGKPNASVVNLGTINIADTGIAAFVAPGVRNDGAIIARLGKVTMASANGFTLDLYGDNLVHLVVDDKVATQAIGPDGQPLNAAVDNSGTIKADGGFVVLTANAAQNVVNNVVNNSGVIEAKTVSQQSGKIILSGYGANVVNSGVLDVSGIGEANSGTLRLISTEQVFLEKTGVALAKGGKTSGDGGLIVIASPKNRLEGIFSVLPSNTNDNAGWYYIGDDINFGVFLKNPNESGSGRVDLTANAFEQNLGQVKTDASYIGQADGQSLLIGKGNASIGLSSSGYVNSNNNVNWKLQNTNKNSEFKMIGDQTGTSTYINADGSVQTIARYATVKQENIYDGIDLVYYRNAKGDLEYDFQVAVGADPQKIGFTFDDDVEVLANGDLYINKNGTPFVKKAPLVYQNTNQGRQIISAKYVVDNNRNVKFELADYDKFRPLVIDPVIAGYDWSLNFNDNAAPSGWAFTKRSGSQNSAIRNGALEAWPTDSSGIITKTVQVPTITDEIRVSWVGNITYSAWGMSTSMQFTANNVRYSLLGYWNDSSSMPVNTRSKSLFWIRLGTEAVPTSDALNKSLFGTFKYESVIKKGQITFKVTDTSNGTVIYNGNRTFTGFDPKSITELQFVSATTTNATATLDDATVQFWDNPTVTASTEKAPLIKVSLNKTSEKIILPGKKVILGLYGNEVSLVKNVFAKQEFSHALNSKGDFDATKLTKQETGQLRQSLDDLYFKGSEYTFVDLLKNYPGSGIGPQLKVLSVKHQEKSEQMLKGIEEAFKVTISENIDLALTAGIAPVSILADVVTLGGGRILTAIVKAGKIKKIINLARKGKITKNLIKSSKSGVVILDSVKIIAKFKNIDKPTKNIIKLFSSHKGQVLLTAIQNGVVISQDMLDDMKSDASFMKQISNLGVLAVSVGMGKSNILVQSAAKWSVAATAAGVYGLNQDDHNLIGEITKLGAEFIPVAGPVVSVFFKSNDVKKKQYGRAGKAYADFELFNNQYVQKIQELGLRDEQLKLNWIKNELDSRRNVPIPILPGQALS